jgi:phosphoglycolate phosphatase-like HAD superfamily hydrolase
MNLVVFDLDGTLTQTFAVDGDCYLQAFADSLGMNGVNDNWSDYEHVTDLGVMQEVFRARLGRAPHSAEVTGFVECFVELLRDRYQGAPGAFGEVPGAAAFVARLRQSRWAVAIATGGWERSARFKIETAGIGANDVPAAFAEDGPARHTIVTTAIARASSYYQQNPFERIVLVGDAIWDVRTATDLCLPFVAVGQGERAARLRELGTSHVVRDFIDDAACFRCLEEARIPDAS